MAHTPTFIQDFELLSYIYTGGCYVMDIVKEQFCYIKSNDLFLCGFSAEEALHLGVDFYTRIIYPEDLSLWNNIRKATLLYLRTTDKQKDEIDHFSCTFRLLRKYSFVPRPLTQMIYLRTKPVWIADTLQYLICTVESSTIRTSGNLLMHNKDESSYAEYNFGTKRWKEKEKVSLTERESAILILAQQGKNSTEIASLLCKGDNTVRNQMKALYAKLEVHSMQEAIELVNNFRLIYPKSDIESENR